MDTMTRFNINKIERSPEEWSAIAFRQTTENNIQWKIAGGLILGAIAASATSPITGALVAGWAIYSGIKEAKDAQRNQVAIREYGCVAHVLEGDDFRRYLQQVGVDAVEQELSYAADQSYKFSDAAIDYVEDKTESQVDSEVKGAIAGTALTNVLPQSQTQIDDYKPDYTIDIIGKMTERITNRLIVGVPGTGKGMLLANAVRAAKAKHQGLRVYVIDPKADPKETGYFDGIADVVKRYPCAEESPKVVMEWIEKCFADYTDYVNNNGRTLLILDEGTLLGRKSKLAKSTFLIDRLSSLTSSGDSSGKNIWIAAQSPYVGPLGLDLDSSSQLSGIVIARDYDSVKQWGRSAMLDKITADELKALVDSSPCGRAVYFGKEGKWFSMPILENYSGYNRDTRSFVGAEAPQDSFSASQQEELKAAIATKLSATEQMIIKLESTEQTSIEQFIIRELKAGDRVEQVKSEIIRRLKDRDRADLLQKFNLN